jgi:hypothetical protein
MKRMTLKTAAELTAEKHLTRDINLALDLHSREATYHAQMSEKLLRLALRRNHLLARSEDTSEVDAEIKAALEARD